MAVNNKKLSKKTFGELVDDELEKRGSSRRWLMLQLNKIGLELTDTQLSNRCRGYIQFEDGEKEKINEVLGTDF